MDGCIGVFEVVKFHTKRHRAQIKVKHHEGDLVSRKFQFELFRLNIEDLPDLFNIDQQGRLRSNEAVLSVLEIATSPSHDQEQETSRSIYRWSLREAQLLADPSGRQLLHVLLARSTITKEGLIVTKDGIQAGTSSMNPPLASTATIFIDMSRHLVAVEHTGELSQTAWKEFFEKIVESAAIEAGYTSKLSLESVTRESEIVKTFHSFELVTRLRVTLRIPNPELNRFTRALFEELKKADIREILQDMKNPSGISKEPNALPHAAATIADMGYRKDEAIVEGIRDGQLQSIRTGAQAARGSIQQLKDFVRGLHANSKTKEANQALSAITQEIDRLLPPPQENEGT